ncbi:tetratricopeptide repeat protein [Tsuneonella sp. HG249]
MSFVPIILLAGAAFAFAALALRLPRSGWTLLGAALMFGLAGYALQGSPGQAGAPKAAIAETAEGSELVEARRAIYGPAQPSRYVTVADGFARRGQYADAAGILRSSLAASPDDPEAWLALANAITEHAGGQLTPAAVFAFERAERADPGQPGPGFFMGVALIRNGRLQQARDIWARMLAAAPPDAVWREGLEERLTRLDRLIAESDGQ